MPEETPSTQPTPTPAPTPAQAQAQAQAAQAWMQAQAQTPPRKEPPKKEVAPKKKGGWFQKIPADTLLSPGGVVLIFLALIIEIIDWIPLPVLDQIIELPLEILFIALFVIITKASFKSLIIPFIIERIPLISDICPTWLLRMFV